MGGVRWVVTGTLVSAGVLAVVLLKACGDEPKQPPPERDPRILVVDGVEIRRSELAEYEPYLRQLDPTMGEMTRLRELIQQFLLPLKMARRDFQEQRRVQRQRAEAVIKSLSPTPGADELMEQTKRVPGARKLEGWIRQHMQIPEQRWAFDDARVLQASPILETPLGFTILASLRKDPGPTLAYDKADIWFVPFHTHETKAFGAWWAKVQKDVAHKLTYVHPDYAEALPYWLKQ